MLKRLAILGLLYPLASAWGMAGQSVPTNAPEIRVTAQSTGKAGSQQTSPNQGDANSPISAPVNVKTSGSRYKQESDTEKENLDIQRKLEWFTCGLVIVGLMQAFTMIWQARLLRGTLRQIQTQAGHMERQTKILEDSVTAAQKSADAAIAQVEAAKKTQRAQLRIEFADFDFGFDSGGFPVRFTVTLDGTTRAYILSEAIIAYTSGLPPEKRSVRKQIGLPRNFTPETSPVETYTLIQTGSGFPEVETDVTKIWAVRENSLFLFVSGYILYRDIFGDSWRLEFSYTWKNWSSFGGDTKAAGGMWSAADMYGGYRHSKVEEQPTKHD